MKELTKIKKDYLNSETAHKATEEKFKKNIEDLTAESAKLKQESEKIAAELLNHKKQIADMEEKDAKKTQEALALKEDLKAQSEKLNITETELHDTKSKKTDCEKIIENVNLLRHFIG
jgi:chromosome segregation ATPase